MALGGPDPLKRLSALSSKHDLSDLRIPTITDEAEEVEGMNGRIRLRKDEKTAKTFASRNWMDNQRKYLQAYEYLCHIGEAKEWMEACLEEEISSIADLEETLRNGIVLAKLAKWFAPEVVKGKRIFTGQRLQFRHSDNINYFFQAIAFVKLPQIFWFELTDLYEKKNIPKVVYCIHALSHLLANSGVAPTIRNLVGALEFTDEQLHATQRGLDLSGVSMPNFSNVGQSLRKELAVNYVEEEECEEETQVVELVEEPHFDELLAVKLQALVKGTLLRRDFDAMLDQIQDIEPTAIRLQAQIRGVLKRRQRKHMMQHYKQNLHKIVKIQCFYKKKLANDAYRRLKLDQNPSISTVKAFVHLLDSNNLDFEIELEIERLRQQTIKQIREDAELEHDLNDLDIKIALLVKNSISLDEVMKVSKRMSGSRQKEALAQLVQGEVANPFNLKNLDKTSRRRLELYQQLFYILQTEPQYLARLLYLLNGSSNMSDSNRRIMDTVVLSLFGYAQDAREEYLLLKLFKHCIQEELNNVDNIQQFSKGNYTFARLMFKVNRNKKERDYLRKAFGSLIQGIIEDDFINVETDPEILYRAAYQDEEARTGQTPPRPYNVTAQQAMQYAPTRATFIKNLQTLRQTTEDFLQNIMSSLAHMPYGVRFICKEMREALLAKFPSQRIEAIDQCILYFLFYRYFAPAIVAPNVWNIVEVREIPADKCKALGNVAKMLQHIAAGKSFGEDDIFLYPLNDYVSSATDRIRKWSEKVTGVSSLDSYFCVHAYSEFSTQTKPVIYISQEEIFHVHELLGQHLDELPAGGDDKLRSLLEQLGSVPTLQQLKELAGRGEISLTLVNGAAHSLSDPDAVSRRLFIETRRLVVSIMKVQSGNNLLDIMTKPVTSIEEKVWRNLKQQEHREGASRGKGAHLQRLSFAEIKKLAITNLLKLELDGRVTRKDGFQEMINSIAAAIVHKNHLRESRQKLLPRLRQTLVNLESKRLYLDGQLQSYNDYLDSCVSKMTHKGQRQRYTLPFTRQYFHLRELKRTGKVPKFGSYKYTAQTLYERGVLLKLEGINQKQYDKVSFVVSSNEEGVFVIEATVPILGFQQKNSIVILFNDLLYAQFDGIQNLKLLDEAVELNVNLLIFLINKKFYV